MPTVPTTLWCSNILFSTTYYYGGGLPVIDISNPFTTVEVGYFFGKPVTTVRWAHEIADKPVMKNVGSGLALRHPSGHRILSPLAMFSHTMGCSSRTSTMDSTLCAIPDRMRIRFPRRAYA